MLEYYDVPCGMSYGNVNKSKNTLKGREFNFRVRHNLMTLYIGYASYLEVHEANKIIAICFGREIIQLNYSMLL